MSRLLANVAAVATGDPHRVAVVSDRQRITYAELARRAEHLARAMAGRPRLRLVAGEAVEVAVAMVAAEHAGASLLLCDARGRPAEWDRAARLFEVTHELNGEGVRDSPVAPTGGPAGSWDAGGLGLCTSGTQGPPKCVQRPWSAVVDNASAFAAGLELDAGEVVACTSPPHHSYSVCGGLLTALVGEARYVAVTPSAGPRRVAAAIDEHRVSLLLSVPLLYRWYAEGVPATYRPRLCLSAGAGLPQEDRQRWAREVGWRLGEHYGTSEHGMISLDSAGTPGCVGAPLAGVDVRLLEVDPAELPEGALGEIAVRAPAPPPRLLAAGQPPTVLSGYQRTGDLAGMDSAGRLYLLGRRGDVVNIAGNKVTVAEVEEAIRGFPGVRDSAVVGVDGSGGAPAHLSAFVEVDGGLDQRALREFLRTRLAAYKVPTAIAGVDGLPRTASGKVQRGRLASLRPGGNGS